ncbi:MAG: hypothetical protein H3C62_00290 [Gemmatimonadaceae bacterium]|nr:hypothetical protein [Gemmatimonadaceae bacterium]
MSVAATQQGPLSIENEFRAIGEEEPDFGGLYLASDGTPVITMKGGKLSELSRGRILARVAQRNGTFSAFGPSAVRQVPYSFRELDALRTRVRAMIRESGVLLGVGIDVATGTLDLRAAGADLSRAARALTAAGIPSTAFTLTKAPFAVPATTLRDVVRPVTGGVQIGMLARNDSSCSVGLQVWKNDANGYPDPSLGRYVLTANHCAPPQGTVTGVQFGQPHVGYGVHATEVDNAEYFTDARCPYGAAGCQYADVAVLRMADSVGSTWQRVALSNTSSPPSYLGQLSLNTSIWSAVQGQPVRRVGKTSGQRDGTITRTCVDVVRADGYILCSAEVSGYSAGGDSGGPVYTPYVSQYSGSPWPSGVFHSLLPGNNTWYFSTVGYILYALGGVYSL